MPTDADFLRAMAARPFDDLPRLQYADWLDDRGDARGEWVRLEVAVCPHFRHTEGWGRFAALSATLPPGWLAAAGWYRWPLLVAQLGRRRHEKHFFGLREALPGRKNYASYSNGGYSEVSVAAAVGLKFHGGRGPDVLTTVTFYAYGADGSERYLGPLPYGLSFEASRSEVTLLLGRPDRGAEAHNAPVWQAWDDGIGVQYRRAGLDDHDNTIAWVTVTPPVRPQNQPAEPAPA